VTELETLTITNRQSRTRNATRLPSGR